MAADVHCITALDSCFMATFHNLAASNVSIPPVLLRLLLLSLVASPFTCFWRLNDACIDWYCDFHYRKMPHEM
eukprot:870377-Amphidinium_carterae.2